MTDNEQIKHDLLLNIKRLEGILERVDKFCHNYDQEKVDASVAVLKIKSAIENLREVIPEMSKDAESIIAFVMLKENVSISEDKLRSELRETIRTQIGPIATPNQFYIVNKLPKTRSGKIMRRLLKAIAQNETIGDVSTLEDGAAVSEIQSAFQELQKNIQNQKQ